MRSPRSAPTPSITSPATGGRERWWLCYAEGVRLAWIGQMATRVKPKPNEIYDKDFYAWSKEQVHLPRAGRFAELDLDHLIEEVDGFGWRPRAVGAASHWRDHCAPVEARALAGAGPAAGWYDTIIAQRSDLFDELTPSLTREVEADFPRLYDRARADAATSLQKHGEQAAADALPATCPYTLDQIAGDWWP